MRRILLCWKPRCCPTWLLQLCATIFIITVMYFYHRDRMSEQHHNLLADFVKRDTIGGRVYDQFQCDNNRRQVVQLQRLLREKTQLLHYRGRVITGLRKTVAEVNKTKNFYKHTLGNLTEAVVTLHTSSNMSQLSTPAASGKSQPANDKNKNKKPSHFDDQRFNSNTFSNLRESASKASLPCCIALNRMTDILREYMETTQELRLTVADFRQNNTPYGHYSAPIILSTEENLKKGWNFTKRPEKYASYQLFANNFFYESIPLNRVEPKQKLKTRIFRRNFDFQFAAKSASADVCRKLKLTDPSQLQVKDAIFRYDELYGAHYKFTFVYAKDQQLITSDVTKPYTSYATSNIRVTKAANNNNDKLELINIVVSVSKRSDRLVAFLRNIHELRERKQTENIFVTIVIYDQNEESRNQIKTSIKRFSAQNNFTGYDILKRDLPFNRGRALHDGIMRWNGYSDVLIFLCDVDIKVKSDFFDRCRHFPDIGKSVYMPIVYSLYNPDIVFNGNRTLFNTTDKAYDINQNTGTWRPFGYGMACFYKPDYLRAGGFNLQINGWGREDYNLYGR